MLSFTIFKVLTNTPFFKVSLFKREVTHLLMCSTAMAGQSPSQEPRMYTGVEVQVLGSSSTVY